MRGSRAISVGTVIVATLVTWANMSRTADATTTLGDRTTECPHHQADVQIALVISIRNVPEYHDCQRFIRKESGKLVYDTVFAILASSKLPNIEAELAQPLPILTGTRGASGADRMPLVAVAVVKAAGPYAPLHIDKGFNCLYLQRPLSGQWRAWMIPVASTRDCEPMSVVNAPADRELELRRAQVDNYTNPDDYPAVARWDWDPDSSEQYIGIECGAAWCEIGKRGFVQSAPPSVDDITDPGERRVRRIKGWHDRQLLAYPGTNGLVPSNVMGIVLPHPRLGELKDGDFKRDVRVATIILESTSDADKPVLDLYRKRFNLDKVEIDGPMKYLIKGKADDWRARIKRPLNNWPFDDDETYTLIRHKHTNPDGTPTVEVPGVARWRWLSTDEGTWVRCSEGCCELNG